MKRTLMTAIALLSLLGSAASGASAAASDGKVCWKVPGGIHCEMVW